MRVDHLDFYKGELVFLLGSSGSGKSTLLETLGLMNNTIVGGDILLHNDSQNTISYKDLWSSTQERDLSDIRRKHFSFVFQNTNLMDNFTAYENVCLSGMIKDNQLQRDAMKGATELMERVGLGPQHVTSSTLASNLSGGQRQRVAFVRALNSRFNVLFGDEPTGNLDEGNANELMGLVKNQLSGEQAAIVVSHDINLALNHASRIIVLTKEVNEKCGTVNPANIFERKDWEGLNHSDQQIFRSKLKDLYGGQFNVRHEKAAPLEAYSIAPVGNQDYRRMFMKKEGVALMGKKMVNFILLLAMVTLTFLAIGFANGSLSYLDEKIKNPFVNWLTITIPYMKRDDIPDIIRDLQKADNKASFNYKSVSGFVEQPLRFWSNELKTWVTIKGRSVDMRGKGDPLMQEILKKNNLRCAHAHNFRSDRDMGIIVTARFLEQLGYGGKEDVVTLEVPVFDTATSNLISLKVPIQIKGIVKEIPGKVEFLYTNYFLQAYRANFDCPLDIRSSGDLQYYFKGSKLNADNFKRTIESYFEANPTYDQNSPQVDVSDRAYDYSMDSGYVVSVNFYPRYSGQDTLDQLATELSSYPALDEYDGIFYRTYDYYRGASSEDELKYDFLSVSFNEVNQVRNFSYFLSSEYNDKESIKTGSGVLEVDTAKVKEKENFLFISKLASIVSYIIILFGAIAVSLYIFNMLKMHLSKVTMNIGTFKAFGLFDNEAQYIYFTLITVFSVATLIIGFLLAILIGYTCNFFLIKNFRIETGVSYFEIMKPFTFYTVLAILLSTFFVSWYTVRRLLKKTPGDLIYSR